MKIRTSLRAGGEGCSPETQYYMQKALDMQYKVQNCVSNSSATYPTEPYYGTLPPYPTTPTTYYGSTGTYPDMSGACG